MGAGEILVIIMLILGCTWVAAKIVGFMWRIVRAPVLGFVAYFFVITSTDVVEYDEPQSNDEPAFSPATTKQQNSNNGIAMPATERNALLLQAKAEALAAMVKAQKIGETDGIKLVFGVSPSSSNLRYIAARAALKEELAKLDPPKFRMTPEQENARNALGLNNAT
jgi:energy-coupling factor transporter transmembrane protein EcfT